MGGFIIGVGLAIIIILIVYGGKKLSQKRKHKEDTDVVELTEDKNIKEKE